MNLDVAELKQAWINELYAPELLPFPKRLVKRIKQQLHNQESNVNNNILDPRERLKAHLQLLEISRLRYTLSAFLRTRLAKIEKYVWILAKEDATQTKLSKNEKSFFQRYHTLLIKHCEDSFVAQLPAQFQDVSFPPTDLELEHNVFIRVVQDIGDFQPEDAQDSLPLRLEKDDTYVLKYRSIRSLLPTGQIVLA
jgi:GINS complex subunit 4